MHRSEALELWREALSQAEAELRARRLEAVATARRLAQSIAEGTRAEPSLGEIYQAATTLFVAGDDQVAAGVRRLLDAIEAAAPTTPSDGAAILIVDDDAVTRHILD